MRGEPAEDMNSKRINTILSAVVAIFSALLLFLCISAVSLNITIFNQNFHNSLFSKNKIYSGVYNAASHSLESVLNEYKNYFPQEYEQYKDIFISLNEAITPEMVKYNLDSFLEGFFKYFKGETKILPDIYLYPEQNDENDHNNNHTNNNYSAAMSSNSVLQPAMALASIDKINLEAILLYINRSDLRYTFDIIKLIYYIFHSIPSLTILVFLLFLSLSSYISKKINVRCSWIIKTARRAFLFCSILFLLSGILLLVYSFIVMPDKILPIVMSLPLDREIIISYIRHCIFGVSISFILSALLFGALYIALKLSYKTIINVIKFRQSYFRILYKYTTAKIRSAIHITLPVILTLMIFWNVHLLSEDYKNNNFGSVIRKLSSTSTSTQVIPAEDAAIYMMEMIVLDKNTEQPIPGINVYISSKLNPDNNNNNSNYNYKENDNINCGTNFQGITDEKGSVRFNLYKGAFKLSFLPDTIPSIYETPSPVFFELKKVGTTIITVSLDYKDEFNMQKLGIIEVEVLDINNKPVEGMQLSINRKVKIPDTPDYLFSITNSEGIAVFKMPQGNYTVSFSENSVPEGYIVPKPFEANASSGKVSRYTVRLSK